MNLSRASRPEIPEAWRSFLIWLGRSSAPQPRGRGGAEGSAIPVYICDETPGGGISRSQALVAPPQLARGTRAGKLGSRLTCAG